jgi:uncharacterized membrane protein YhaH (DUF805 family)
MFKNPFSFNGRIRRLEFCLSYFFYWVFLLAIEEVSDYNVITGLLVIPLFWFILAQGAKRCHDRGNNGFYIIIPFYIFWLVFAEGDEGKNEYGINPKDIVNRLEIDKPELE